MVGVVAPPPDLIKISCSAIQLTHLISNISGIFQDTTDLVLEYFDEVTVLVYTKLISYVTIH